jgi:inosose dehydratase
MQIRIANAPTSWGVEDPEDGANPRWDTLLTDVADVGYAGAELGPLGYLPEDPAVLRRELSARGLALVGGYVFEPLHTVDGAARALEVGRRTGALLAAAGAVHLVIIQGFSPRRERAAGRPGVAPAATDAEWENMAAGIEGLARIAAEEFGLAAVFHPHAGTHVEFEDEIERLVAGVDVPLCIDTGHCAYAGVDPVALYIRHAERVAYFHLKDVDGDRLESALARGLSFEQAVAKGVFCPLGDGVVDFRALAAALAARDFHGWATVEQDRLPTDSTAPAEHAAASLAHLRQAGLA